MDGWEDGWMDCWMDGWMDGMVQDEHRLYQINSHIQSLICTQQRLYPHLVHQYQSREGSQHPNVMSAMMVMVTTIGQ
jgi:hypothetical protein